MNDLNERSNGDRDLERCAYGELATTPATELINTPLNRVIRTLLFLHKTHRLLRNALIARTTFSGCSCCTQCPA
jgi:hypothetical protein